ncbi:unnamed protein product [Caenorhabditis sp. 36 PRJEB53466]|nr:unnamed protein product [Caenorhabditis sp. 36 PRJEB53466]
MTHYKSDKENACFKPPTQEAITRPLVIDGCNIGRSASGYARTHVDCAGLVSVVRWLLLRNFDVTVFLPVVYNNINNYNSRNAELLTKLEQLGIVTFTPARSGRGLRKAFINYDDLYVVSYAARHGGTILSGDKFKDILNQQCYSDFHDVIRNRTIDVKFRPLTLDYVSYNGDKFYRHAPELFTYDNLGIRSELIRHRLYALPHEHDYNLVKTQKGQITDERRAFLCSELESVLTSMSYAAGKLFREVTELPCMDNHYQGVRIEDVASRATVEAFYKRYPRRETKSDPSQEWVMEPIMEVLDAPRRDVVSIIGGPAAPKLKNTAENQRVPEPPSEVPEQQEPEPEQEPEPPAPAPAKVVPQKIQLPRDLSLKSLLEWFTLAEEARKIQE